MWHGSDAPRHLAQFAHALDEARSLQSARAVVDARIRSQWSLAGAWTERRTKARVGGNIASSFKGFGGAALWKIGKNYWGKGMPVSFSGLSLAPIYQRVGTFPRGRESPQQAWLKRR